MLVELIRFRELPSTMEEAHARAQLHAPHGTTIIAQRQLMGRGTRGRAWSSEAGGLWMSVIARPRRTDAMEALSLRVGLAAAGTLEHLLPALPRIELKWPNDVIIGGRKIAGILCEARWSGQECQWVAIGVGLNVTNPIPEHISISAGRLLDWDPSVTVEQIAAPLAHAIAAAAIDAGPLTTDELRDYARRDQLAGRRVLEPWPGAAQGIAASGALLIRTDAGPVREALGGVVTAAG